MGDDEPSFPSPAAGPAAAAANDAARWSPRAIARGGAGVLLLVITVAAVGASQVPAFYARARGAEAGEAAETRARRAVSKASAWHAALSRPGGWDAVMAEEEINAWLAVDLPRSHAGLLPRGLSQPRLAFRPRHLAMGARLGVGPVATIAWIDCEIILREPNQLTVAVDRARLGAIPLPNTPALGAIGRQLRRLGMQTDIRRVDGRMVLAVHLPATHDAGGTSCVVESMSFTDGEWLVTGTNREAGARRASAPALTGSGHAAGGSARQR